MKTRKIKLITTMSLVFFLIASVSPQTGGSFTITEAVIAGGGRQSSGGNFSLDGTIGQAVAGNALSGGQFSLTSGFWNFTPAPIIETGIEGDIIIRPNGDAFVDADDIQQIRRFSVGLDLPYQLNEFQRADCSPRSSRGDGFVDADDVAQARRYSVGFDQQQPAGGPTAPPQNRAAAEEAAERANLSVKGAEAAQGRAVRVISQTSSAGQTVVVPINVDTMGDETGYTFSIDFDETRLAAASVVIGDLGGNVIANISNTAGTIGFSVTSFSGANGTIAPVMNVTLVRVNFTILANAAAGEATLTFTDTPARRRVSGVDPQQPLPQPEYENGQVTINAPTAAQVSISGRALTPSGRGLMNATVVMTDSFGNERTARTTTFGYFRFEAVEVGQIYIVSVRSKRYRFEPQAVTVNDHLTELNFTAVAEARNTR